VSSPIRDLDSVGRPRARPTDRLLYTDGVTRRTREAKQRVFLGGRDLTPGFAGDHERCGVARSPSGFEAGRLSAGAGERARHSHRVLKVQAVA